jgi:hypothetical protein
MSVTITERTPDGYWVTLGDDASKFARWERSIYRDRNGEIFVPAADFGDESKMFLAADREGVSLMVREGHVYTPLDWARFEHPDNPCIGIYDRWIKILDEHAKASVRKEARP